MEQARASDNSSPPSTVNLPTTFGQEDPLLSTPDRREFDAENQASPSPPSTTDSQHAKKSRFSRFEPLPSKPLLEGFERPSFSRIAILTALCPAAYPAFYLLTLIARDRSLFVVRFMVSMWCSAVGFVLGYILLKIGAQHLEAATWATTIHMSYEGNGMKLRELARGTSSPTSPMPALHIFRSRFGNRNTTRPLRKSYDKQPWYLFLVLFVVLAILGPLLPFLFGRVIEIKTFVRNQSEVYHEVLIAGDLSQNDLEANDRTWMGGGVYRIWPTFPYGGSTSDTAELSYGNDTVYFAQPSLSQFIPGGSGAFSNNQPASIGLKDTPNNTPALVGKNATKSNTGAVLRYSQWGIRINCEKLPDPQVNLIPLSSQNFTYAFVPRDFLRGLFAVYDMDLPTQFTESPLYMVDANDTVPPNIDPSATSVIAKFPQDGVCVSLQYDEVTSMSDQEWMTIETVLVRINASRYTRYGRFPVKLNETLPSGFEVTIGYDAAVCALKYEPWIIEAYNTSTGPPSVLRIVEKGSGSTSLSPSGKIQGDPIANTRYLNKTGKGTVFNSARGNSVYQIVKDDGLDSYYPSPPAVSFTDGTGPGGYTELSPDRLAITRARVGAVNTLPYLVGDGRIVARSYADETLAYTTFTRWQLISLPILIWILGVIGELFVPTLPLGVPRREFGVYSWLALFQSQELQFEAVNDLRKFMSLDELEEKFSDKRVKFVEKGEIEFFGSSD